MTKLPHKCRQGGSLLELLTTLAITATLLASSMVVMRSSYAAWQVHRDDAQQADSADVVLQHFVTTFRQASSITYIGNDQSAATPYSYLGIRTHDQHDHLYYFIGDTAVYYRTDIPYGSWVYNFMHDDLVGSSIVGYEADGVTETTEIADIKSVRLSFDLSAGTSGTRSYSTYAWIRSW